MRKSSFQWLLVTLAIGGMPALGASVTPVGRVPESTCEAPRTGGLPELDRVRLDRIVLRVQTLFRLHRTRDAVRKLDWVLGQLKGPSDSELAAAQQKKIASEMGSFRNCIAKATAPPLATLTIRTVMQRDDAPPWPEAPDGGYVYVDDIRVSRTGADDTITLHVPSGSTDISVVLVGGLCGRPTSCAGWTTVDLAPGAAAVESLFIEDSKEPAEETDLELVRSPAEALPAPSRSFTLRFVEDGVLVPVTKISEVWVLDADGREKKRLDETTFEIERGAIRSKDAVALAADLPATEWISLSVLALDRDGLTRAGTVRFRSVRLRGRPGR